MPAKPIPQLVQDTYKKVLAETASPAAGLRAAKKVANKSLARTLTYKPHFGLRQHQKAAERERKAAAKQAV